MILPSTCDGYSASWSSTRTSGENLSLSCSYRLHFLRKAEPPANPVRFRSAGRLGECGMGGVHAFILGHLCYSPDAKKRYRYSHGSRIHKCGPRARSEVVACRLRTASVFILSELRISGDTGRAHEAELIKSVTLDVGL